VTDAEARLEAFFAQRGWTVFPFQREAWNAFVAGESGLVHAPTGTGKTLAVWGGPILEALRRAPRAGRGKVRALRVLWITPLRALAADTQENLAEVVRALGIDWVTLRRTGDTKSTERAKVKRGECDALITTPESLSLLLSYDDAAERFASLDAVVVDEWHELLGTKRGVLLELSLARLRALAPKLRTWGLSATLGNLEQARE
jgi:ATP-dependent helicase Lhr and Lhr-like helicase